MTAAANEACKLAEAEEGKSIASLTAACAAATGPAAAPPKDAVQAVRRTFSRSLSAEYNVELDPKLLEAGERPIQSPESRQRSMPAAVAVVESGDPWSASALRPPPPWTCSQAPRAAPPLPALPRLLCGGRCQQPRHAGADHLRCAPATPASPPPIASPGSAHRMWQRQRSRQCARSAR